jgi:hypothetical protein
MGPIAKNVLRVACASVAVVGLARAVDITAPNIKPGLWEVTSNPKFSGQMPISEEQLAKMPPDRRAKFEAAMQSTLNNEGKPRVYKECMTPEKIARGFEIEKRGDDKSCKRNVIHSSSSELQIHDECTKPDGKSVTDLHFQVAGGTQMTGKVDVVITTGTRTMTVNSTLQGKWLGANCGTVKDAEPVK